MTQVVLKQDETKAHRKVLENYVTNKFLARMFRRSELTILIWKEKQGLPHVIIPGDRRDAIRYDLDEVLGWAKEHDRRIYVTPRPDSA